MKRYARTLALLLLPAGSWAQTPLPQLAVRPISLPAELAYYDNQFSGLAIRQKALFLLSESRLQDKAEGKLYRIELADLERQLADTAYTLPYRKYPLVNLAVLQGKINAQNQEYEGLEALAFDGKQLYFSVETTTLSPNCYLLKGTLQDSAVVLDTGFLLALPKPTRPDGSHIYNAGFEAISKDRNTLLSFFEYNYFDSQNYAYQHTLSAAASPATALPLARLPFRITDITRTTGRHFTAINYFFKGEGEDTVYRTPATDPASTALIRTGAAYHNYCRLVAIRRRGRELSWQPIGELPGPYMGYNWEGLAAHKKGYFLINDKYTPQKPFTSTLVYIRKP
ncbi:hypothetical protein [Hymenobacter metallicola]|uniref:Uncharacterized protein n=1 Tax=Hymenobacter metallicola TaxID=2563114 RepID=A0A4Z0QG02_9BACT|nr:hypothetical protein [Hymenobacter metallicola]TGE27961.1 hypothetical protein E5K02_00410 [Hymenobacter metallicola]